MLSRTFGPGLDGMLRYRPRVGFITCPETFCGRVLAVLAPPDEWEPFGLAEMIADGLRVPGLVEIRDHENVRQLSLARVPRGYDRLAERGLPTPEQPYPRLAYGTMACRAQLSTLALEHMLPTHGETTNTHMVAEWSRVQVEDFPALLPSE